MSDVDERLSAYFWHRASELLAASGIEDFEPLSMAVDWDAGTLTLTVRSRSRGPVAIGSIEREQLEAGIAAVTDEQIAVYREHERDAKLMASMWCAPTRTPWRRYGVSRSRRRPVNPRRISDARYRRERMTRFPDVRGGAIRGLLRPDPTSPHGD